MTRSVRRLSQLPACCCCVLFQLTAIICRHPAGPALHKLRVPGADAPCGPGDACADMVQDLNLQAARKYATCVMC